MAKVMLICGKLYSGKSWYCRELMRKSPALLLSVDEVTERVFDKSLGERHDIVSAKIQSYLLDKAAEALSAGADVILDWGFWTRSARLEASEFFRERGAAHEWHYIDVPDEVWQENIVRRNKAVLAGEDDSYYVDEGLPREAQRPLPAAGARRDGYYIQALACRHSLRCFGVALYLLLELVQGGEFLFGTDEVHQLYPDPLSVQVPGKLRHPGLCQHPV